MAALTSALKRGDDDSTLKVDLCNDNVLLLAFAKSLASLFHERAERSVE
jgi:hypothetical protein